MKKILVLFFIISLFTFGLVKASPYMQVSTQTKPTFARIKYSNVMLYSSPSQKDNYENKICLLEPSYFVEILKSENNLFFKVKYLEEVGYVLKNKVECVFETPEKPYPDNITFSSTNFSNVVLRSEPTTKNAETSALYVLPPNSTLKYIGKISGETAIEGLNNEWYYCSYTTLNNQTIKGYVYAPLTHNFTSITENTEATTIAEYLGANSVNSLLQINPKFHFTLIILTILPAFALFYIFLNSSKKNKTNL